VTHNNNNHYHNNNKQICIGHSAIRLRYILRNDARVTQCPCYIRAIQCRYTSI